MVLFPFGHNLFHQVPYLTDEWGIAIPCTFFFFFFKLTEKMGPDVAGLCVYPEDALEARPKGRHGWAVTV